MMEFETLTFAPIDLNLVEAKAAHRSRAHMAQRLPRQSAHDAQRQSRRRHANLDRRSDEGDLSGMPPLSRLDHVVIAVRNLDDGGEDLSQFRLHAHAARPARRQGHRQSLHHVPQHLCRTLGRGRCVGRRRPPRAAREGARRRRHRHRLRRRRRRQDLRRLARRRHRRRRPERPLAARSTSTASATWSASATSTCRA